MSADRVTLFYGVRLIVAEEEIPILEDRSHPIIRNARQNKLDHWWGTDNWVPAKTFMLVGKQLGALGFEAEPYVTIEDEQMEDIMSETKQKLRQGGFKDRPALHAQFEGDY
jgi:hypothetical protein